MCQTGALRLSLLFSYTFVIKVLDTMSSFAEVIKAENSRKIVVGVCCMEGKWRGKPMQQIVSRLKQFPELEIVSFTVCGILLRKMFFGDILKAPPEEWP